MRKRTTIKDIAEYAGVSVGTVHCALAGKCGVSEETRQRILEIARKNNYRPNAVAASLKRKTIRIGAAFPALEGDNRFYFPPVWKGVRDYLESIRDYNVMLVEFPYRKGEERNVDEIVELHGKGELGGLVTVGFMDDFGQSSMAKFDELGLPVVLVGDDQPESRRLCCVRPNYQVLGRILAEQITRQIPGDAGILLCAGTAGMPSQYLIADGFEAYLRENGLKHAVYRFHGETYGGEEVEHIAGELTGRPGIAGCVAVNARGSALLGRALTASGLAGKIRAIGNDVFEENIEFLRNGTFTNILNKNPYLQARRAAQVMSEYLVRDVKPAADVLFVNSEMLFQSSLEMLPGEGLG